MLIYSPGVDPRFSGKAGRHHLHILGSTYMRHIYINRAKNLYLYIALFSAFRATPNRAQEWRLYMGYIRIDKVYHSRAERRQSYMGHFRYYDIS